MRRCKLRNFVLAIVLPLVLCWLLPRPAQSQNFDFAKLESQVKNYSVIIEIQIEVSFGINSSDQEERYLGTIVTEDGLVIFDGTDLASDNLFSSFSGVTVKTTPTKISVTTLDGIKYEAEYLGFDRFTKVGFLKVKMPEGVRFKPIKFSKQYKFKVGEWVALYMLMPEFVSPPLAADIGMVSNLIQSPENFPLTVGFSAIQLTAVLYNSVNEPVGVLGNIMDPSSSGSDMSGMLESFGDVGIPLLGVITADRIEKLITNPPTKGEIERGWLGISLQALTKDIAEFWNLPLSGGIIVNEIIRNSPADVAGLRIGDIIYVVNGEPVEVDREDKVAVFQRKIAALGPGIQVELGIMRTNNNVQDTLTLLVTLQKAPMSSSDAPEFKDESLEMTVRDLVFADYMAYNLDSADFKGVVVSQLIPGGPASIGGLSLGDVIQRIGSAEIKTVAEAKLTLENVAANHPREVIFFIWRQNQTMFVNVKPNWN